MKNPNQIPLELLKQDPSTGMYKYGGIEMTEGEYVIAVNFNALQEEMDEIKERLSKIEGK